MSEPNATSTWRIVAEREVRAKFKEKSFVWGFLAMLLISWAGLVALDYFGDRDTTYDLGLVGAPAEAGQRIEAALGEGYVVAVDAYPDREAAEAAITDGDIDAAAIVGDDGWTLVADNDVDAPLEAAVRSSVAADAVARNAAAQDVDLAALNAGAEVQVDLLDPDADDVGQRKLVAFGLSLIFYLVAMLFGMQIAQSVVSEKESRVVEILAAAIPTRALLWGKIAGNTLLALGQVVVLVGGGLAIFAVLGNRTLLTGVGPAMVWFVAFFALGFIALAALWSAAGALSSRVQDIASTTMPLQMVLLAGYMIGAFASGVALDIASQVPVVSAIVMPGRLAYDDVALWEVLLSLGLNVVAAVLLVRLGARIYDHNLMQTNRKVGFGEALRRR
ncbi:ABC transporter permease [Nocardioides currus]|uniref:ABC transporter permease n=1 Tax=Nocardioides currus TaxID=2133958 RepID=A0A2R7YTP7_9ACTN|nr:ABC transporter permease [Nocardioides currus]PUA79762.1 ABC transporter permease [Nocardioides currus]